jgi:hypothetical protein
MSWDLIKDTGAQRTYRNVKTNTECKTELIHTDQTATNGLVLLIFSTIPYHPYRPGKKHISDLFTIGINNKGYYQLDC